MSEKFDIYSKIFFMDVKNFFRYLWELVLRHQMRVSNYFVNSFYSVWAQRRLAVQSMRRVITRWWKLYIFSQLFKTM